MPSRSTNGSNWLLLSITSTVKRVSSSSSPCNAVRCRSFICPVVILEVTREARCQIKCLTNGRQWTFVTACCPRGTVRCSSRQAADASVTRPRYIKLYSVYRDSCLQSRTNANRVWHNNIWHWVWIEWIRFQILLPLVSRSRHVRSRDGASTQLYQWFLENGYTEVVFWKWKSSRSNFIMAECFSDCQYGVRLNKYVRVCSLKRLSAVTKST